MDSALYVLPDIPRAIGTPETDSLLGIAARAFDAAVSVLIDRNGTVLHATAPVPTAVHAAAVLLKDAVTGADRTLLVPDARLDPRFAAAAEAAGLRFMAGVAIGGAEAEPPGALLLADPRPRLPDPADAADLERLRRLAGQDATIRRLSADLAHAEKIFAHASSFAQIGIWQCDLTRGDALIWSEGVYDIFELPRGAPVERSAAVALYAPESRAEMEMLRRKAIAERSGFTLDARIVTAKGNERWMRLTATVEARDGKAVRIFGMKQDITTEKNLWNRTRFLAHFDTLTGLANRSTFQSRLSGVDEDGGDLPVGALLLIDLDGFKQVNDGYGHAAGDACLKHTADRLRAVCGTGPLVARVGGDEFAVVLGQGTERPACEALAEAIVEAVRRPIDSDGNRFAVGASVGIALVDPETPPTPDELFVRADLALYAAKDAGKNTFRTFTPDLTPPALERRTGNRRAADGGRG